MMDELAMGLNTTLEVDRQRNESADNRWFDRLTNADAETLEGYIAFGNRNNEAAAYDYYVRCGEESLKHENEIPF